MKQQQVVALLWLWGEELRVPGEASGSVCILGHSFAERGRPDGQLRLGERPGQVGVVSATGFGPKR